MRPQALSFLRGCGRIIHGGDIGKGAVGSAAVIETLGSIAPVTAVRGNNDNDAWAQRLHETETVEEQGIRLLVIHNLAELRADPLAAGIRVVISGHSHQPSLEERDGVIFINPGSAGPRRFSLPIAVGEVWIDGSSVRPRIVELQI